MTTPESFDRDDRARANGDSPPLEQGSLLATVDDALAAGQVTVDDDAERELQELALTLAADSPPARPGFAADLSRRVDEGFPREDPGRLRRAASRLPAVPAPRLARLSRPSLPVIGVAASALLALVVGISLLGSGDDPAGVGDGSSDTPMTLQAPEESDPGAQGEIGGESARPLAGKSDGAADSAGGAPSVIVPPEPPRGGGEALGERERRVQRAAAMTLGAPQEDLAELAAGIPDVVERRRGFVLRSSVTTGDEGVGGGTFDLRVPVTELDATLANLADLGQVQSQTQTEDDVTGAFVSTRDRLRAARADRRGLLRRLQRADSEIERRGIQRRLELAARRVNRVRGELQGLERRTGFAAVSVSLVEGDGGADGGTSDALDDALDSLLGAFNLALRVLGVVLPLAIVAALAWVCARTLRRRRRESALG